MNTVTPMQALASLMELTSADSVEEYGKNFEIVESFLRKSLEAVQVDLPEGHHCKAWGSTTWRAECGQDLTPNPDKQLMPAPDLEAVRVEPVAWMYRTTDGVSASFFMDRKFGYPENVEETPLYATPQQPAAPEWLPIETAPMDGTPILVYHNRMVIEVWYSQQWEKFVQSETGGINLIEPTHWMPLPAAPKETS